MPRSPLSVLAPLLVLAALAGPTTALAADGDLPYRPSPTPDRVIMTPTSAPERSQTFGWRTDGATAEGRVEAQRLDGDQPVGPLLTAVATTADARDVGHEGGADYAVRHHRAKLVGLDPGTRYRYRVGSDAGWSPWRSFQTTTSDGGGPWRWLYVGDAQNGLDREWPVNMGRALAAVPDAQLILHAGDQVNRPTYDKDWGDWFAGLGEAAATRNHLAVAGNHEYSYDLDSVDLSATNFRAHFPFEPNGPSGANGATVVDYRGVRFITLDTGLTGLFGLSGQARWLDEQLTSNRQRWTVVSFHFPVYTSADRFPSSNPAVISTFGPVLEEHDVDLVLNGHDHTYARGFRTRNGPVYATSVLGPKHYDMQPEGDNTWTRNGATRVVAAQATSTFQAICVLGDQLVYESIIAAKGEETTTAREVGEPLDAVTIDKRGGGKQVREGGRCATGDPAPGDPAPTPSAPTPTGPGSGTPGPGAGGMPAPAGPAVPATGSGTSSGTSPSRPLRWRSSRVVTRDGSLRVRLRVGGPGRLTVRAVDRSRPSRLAARTVRRRLGRAVTRTVTLRPSAAARKALRRSGRLRVRVTATFRPTSGRATTVRRTVTLRRR